MNTNLPTNPTAPFTRYGHADGTAEYHCGDYRLYPTSWDGEADDDHIWTLRFDGEWIGRFRTLHSARTWMAISA